MEKENMDNVICENFYHTLGAGVVNKFYNNAIDLMITMLSKKLSEISYSIMLKNDSILGVKDFKYLTEKEKGISIKT